MSENKTVASVLGITEKHSKTPGFKHRDKIVIKEFLEKSEQYPWLSWRDTFNTHKHVHHWVVTSDGYAVGKNEDTSKRGIGFPVKELSQVKLDLIKSQKRNAKGQYV